MLSLRPMRKRWSGLAALAGCLSLLACDDDPAASGGGSSGGAAAGGAALGGGGSGGDGGAGPDCVDPATSIDAPCGALTIAPSDVTSRKRNHHLTFLLESNAGPFLYVIGGANGSLTLNDVDRFAIRDDGALEPSVAQPSLPIAEGGGTGAIVGRTVVVTGGMRLSGVTDGTYWATIDESGDLGPWQNGASSLHKRMHPGAFAKDDTVWVLGGFDDPDVWDDVVSAKVAADGSLGAWTPAGSLPGKRSHFAITRVGDDLYLTGGLDQSAYQNPPFLSDTWHGRVLADGTVGEWTQGPELPLPLATHASFFYGGYLYVGGGIGEPAHQEDGLWRAPILADRSLGAFEELPTTFSVKRGHVHQLPVFKNHVYSVAGAKNFNLDSTDVIDIGTFE